VHKSYEIEPESKAQRAQGGEGLLSHSISIQGSHKYKSNILTLGDEREGPDLEPLAAA